MDFSVLPIFLFVACVAGLAILLLIIGNLFNPRRPGRVKRMPYESGMDPVHDTRRRFDVRYHLVAIAFLVFDVELLFLYPWAVTMQAKAPGTSVDRSVIGDTVDGSRAGESSQREMRPVEAKATAGPTKPRFAFAGGMVFLVLLALGFIYDWKKGIFHWR
jgi:NADH-quinone oxidoreductase subunit A